MSKTPTVARIQQNLGCFLNWDDDDDDDDNDDDEDDDDKIYFKGWRNSKRKKKE